MKILQIINAFYPSYTMGGAAVVAHYISKALAKRGHEVTVYTTNALSRESLFSPRQNPNYNDGVEVHYFSNIVYEPSTHTYFSKELVEAVRKSIVKHDIVHLHEYRSYISLITRYYSRKHDVPYVLQAHGQLPRTIAKRRLKWIYDFFFGYRLLRDASKVIALSQTEAQQYRAMSVPMEKIEVIPNGIDLSQYNNLPPKGSFRSKYCINENEKIVLYLGRIHKIKGIDFLIKSFAYLVKSGIRDAKLVVAGPDDGYLNTAKELVCRLEISNNVLFTGFLTEEAKISAFVDSMAVVYPSEYEPFGLVSLEAAVFSKPIIMAKGTPLSKVIERGRFGFSVRYGDVEALAKLLEFLMKNDALVSEMGTRGRKYVAANYCLEKVVDKLEKLYEAVGT